MAADVVALGHHAEDQAETLLLQLLRGAGPHGLAAMPILRAARTGGALLRPFLALPRAAIDAYAAARDLEWVDDESNADTSLKRNFVRDEIAPRLAAAFPGYPGTLARAAAHQADAAVLVDELAALDAREMLVVDGTGGDALDRRAFAGLDERSRRIAPPICCGGSCTGTACARRRPRVSRRCAASWRTRPTTRACFCAHDGLELGVHRGRIVDSCADDRAVRRNVAR